MTDTIIINQMSTLGRRIMIRKRQRAWYANLRSRLGDHIQLDEAMMVDGMIASLTGKINKLARSA